MKQLQVLPRNFIKEISDRWLSKGIETIVVEDWTQVSKDIPVLCEAGLLFEYNRVWLNSRQPAIYAGRGYVGNHLHKQRKWQKASVNGWANTTLKSPPHSRWHLLGLEYHPWKVKKIKNVLIAPSKNLGPIWDPVLGNNWANSIVDKFPGAEVKIRPKTGKQGNRYITLWEDLDWADLVVSQSSAITAEAFWYGKKVISTEPCITWAAEKTTLENWDDPTEPKLRKEWHEHLAWCQYTDEEWASGATFECLESYLGSIVSYDPLHTYSFNQ